jgi:ElaB/YqjD/DUF883 family membrane-anchored ribosome-binding protein
MDKIEKMHMMDKMHRELEDISKSQTSLLKKITQLEADNINLGDRVLEKKLPDIHASIDEGLTAVNALQTEFTDARDKFVKDNRLDEVLPVATNP